MTTLFLGTRWKEQEIQLYFTIQTQTQTQTGSKKISIFPLNISSIPQYLLYLFKINIIINK